MILILDSIQSINWVEIIGVIADIVTIFGIVGIILSLYKIYIRSKTPDIRIKIGNGFTYDQFDGPSKSNISIEAFNFCYIPVTLSAYGFILPDNKKYWFYNNAEIYVKIPYTLIPGKSCQVFIEREHFKKSLKEKGYTGKVRLIGFYIDALDHTYKTKPFTLDTDE